MLSEKLVNKIDKKLQEYIDINKLVLSDIDMINDVKDMIFYILEKTI